MKHITIIRIICLIVINIIFANNLMSNNLTECVSDTLKNYKKIYPFYCDPSSDIILKSDSVLFSGYMIFKINKNNKSNKSSNYFYCDIYFTEELCELNPNLKYYYNFAPAAYLGYIGDDMLGDFIDSSDINVNQNTDEFNKFKNFYIDYNNNVYKEKNKTPFLSTLLSTKIFDTSTFWINKGINKYGYFIFKCKFYTAILNYDCSCNNKNINVLLPISETMIFETVNESDCLKKSDWFPLNLK